MASYYTCHLIIHCANKDSDFNDTIRRYYGKFRTQEFLFIRALFIRQHWILRWIDYVGTYTLRRINRLLRDSDAAAIPVDISMLCVVFRQGSLLSVNTDFRVVFIKSLRDHFIFRSRSLVL